MGIYCLCQSYALWAPVVWTHKAGMPVVQTTTRDHHAQDDALQRPPGFGQLNLSNSPILSQPAPPPPQGYPPVQSGYHQSYQGSNLHTQEPGQMPSGPAQMPCQGQPSSHAPKRFYDQSQQAPFVQQSSGNAPLYHQETPQHLPLQSRDRRRHGDGNAPLFHHEQPQQPDYGAVEILPARQPRQQQQHQQQRQQDRLDRHSGDSQRAVQSQAYQSRQHYSEAQATGSRQPQHARHTGLLQRVPVTAEPRVAAAPAYSTPAVPQTGLFQTVPRVQEAQQAAAAACNPRAFHQHGPQQQHRHHFGSSNGSSIVLTAQPQLTLGEPTQQSAEGHHRFPQHAQQHSNDLGQLGARSSSGKVLQVQRQASGQLQTMHMAPVVPAVHSQDLYPSGVQGHLEQDSLDPDASGMLIVKEWTTVHAASTLQWSYWSAW